MFISQLKQRVAENLYYQTMSLLYGIDACSADYPEAELNDDLARIELLESGRDCRYLKLPGTERFDKPIFIQFGTCVPLPFNNCPTCNPNPTPISPFPDGPWDSLSNGYR